MMTKLFLIWLLTVKKKYLNITYVLMMGTDNIMYPKTLFILKVILTYMIDFV